MSSHSVKKIDQKEYLKKYLSGDSNKTKKKKKVKKHKQKADVKVKIIDDDAHATTELDIDEELLLTGEDAPQIVGTYVEENPNGAAAGAVPKWKSIVIKDESDDDNGDGNNYGKVTIKKEPEEEDLWGPKARGAHRIKDEFSPVRRKSPTPDAAEPSRRQMRDERRRHRSRSRSKERKKRGTEERGRTNGKSDRDFSPPRRKNHKDIATREQEPQSNQHSRRRSAERVRSLSSDQSPPRRRRKEIPKQHKRSDSSDISPRRRRRKVDLEDPPSPPRRRRRDNSADQSPPRHKRHADLSPPRHRRQASIDDASPPRRRNADLSPPRRKRQASNDDSSPPRRRNADLSPPRRRRQASNDASPPRRRNADVSPPRRKRQASIEDSSPPRRRNADLSPPRRRAASPPVKIKREKQSPDLSPARRRSRERDASTKSRKVKREISEERQNRWERREPSRSLSPPPTHAKKATKTLDGKRAGLQDAAALQKENQERRRREDEIFAKMSNEMSGRDAEVQVRSDGGRRGRRARQAKELDPEEERRKEEAEKEAKELYERWGKGLKQIEDHRKKIDEEQYESSKPLARYSNDADLERHLREQERAEDPMLEYMRRKKKEKQKNSNEPTRPTYEGPYPENRFGIRPGYRWDGVDRSNGYEKKWFAKENEHRARQDEAYKYSVEDM